MHPRTYVYVFIRIHTYVYAIIHIYTVLYSFGQNGIIAKVPIITFDQNLVKAVLCITKPIIMVQNV